MATSPSLPDPCSLTRFMLALGLARYRHERSAGRAPTVAALRPSSLERVRALGGLCYRRNSRTFEDVIGLELVADEGSPPGHCEVRE